MTLVDYLPTGSATRPTEIPTANDIATRAAIVSISTVGGPVLQAGEAKITGITTEVRNI